MHYELQEAGRQWELRSQPRGFQSAVFRGEDHLYIEVYNVYGWATHLQVERSYVSETDVVKKERTVYVGTIQPRPTPNA